jgi:glucosamine kinase
MAGTHPVTGGMLTIGVDGGASTCRVRLRDAAGREVAAARGPACNIYVDFEGGVGVIRETALRALELGGMHADEARRVRLGIGLAGLSTPEEQRRLASRFADFASCIAANDSVTACLGAHSGADGAIVIAGTGAAAMARAKGVDTIIGGRGFLLGDDGSGARIGADALRAALRAHDGIGPGSGLLRALMDAFGGDATRMLKWARSAKPLDYGAYAPRVLLAAAAGDEIARKIVAAAAQAIAALAEAIARVSPNVALVGGLGEPIRPFLRPDISALLIPPQLDAVDGAILLAGGAIDAKEPA